MLLPSERRRIATYGRRMTADRLVVGTSGNLSIRAGDLLAVTPAGHAYDTLTPELVCVRHLDGSPAEGDLAPTSELPFHQLIYAHTGAAAQEASAAMGAEAYASGNHIAFGSAPDLHTAAHEAAHVVQQKAGVSLSGGVGQVGDKYEQHADQVADAVVQGKSAEPILNQMTGGGSGGGEVQRRAVQRVAAVQRNPTSGGTVTPGRTAETPANTVVPNAGTRVEEANTTRTGPTVAWRKNVDSRGNVAWFVVLEEDFCACFWPVNSSWILPARSCASASRHW